MQCNKNGFSKDYQPLKVNKMNFSVFIYLMLKNRILFLLYIPNADKQDTLSAVSFAGLPIFRQKDQVLL